MNDHAEEKREKAKLPLTYNGPRELDRLVAEKVMGLDLTPVTMLYGKLPWLPHGTPERVGIDPWTETPEPPNYSTRIEDAWKVLEHFYTGYGKDWNVNLFTDQGEIRSWFCEFEWISTGVKYVEEGETPMEAICLAALSAVSK